MTTWWMWDNTWSIHVCSTHLKTRAFFPLLMNVKQLSSSQLVLVTMLKTMLFNLCWESKSPPLTIQGKQYLLYWLHWWNLWVLCVQVSCFQCLWGIVSLMSLWEGVYPYPVLITSSPAPTSSTQVHVCQFLRASPLFFILKLPVFQWIGRLGKSDARFLRHTWETYSHCFSYLYSLQSWSWSWNWRSE